MAGENVGPYAIQQGSLTAGTNYNLTYVGNNLTITKATPTVTWINPADITYGTALSGTQLDATAPVPGSLVYSPAAGTVLNAGQNQTLSVNFTPTDTTNYNTTTKSVIINVTPQTQVTANYTDDPLVTTSSATVSTATVKLSATIQDVSGGSGVISTATVQFYKHDNSGDTPIGTSYVITPINTTTESVSATWTVDIGSLNSQTFTIGIQVGGNYSRNDPSDYSMVTVSKPLSGTTTGGGFIINGSHGTTPGGSVAPDRGKKTIFGFEAKSSSKGTSGQFYLIVRHGSSVYLFAATSITRGDLPGDGQKRCSRHTQREGEYLGHHPSRASEDALDGCVVSSLYA